MSEAAEYKVQAYLGEGTYGTVHAGVHMRTQHRVALKQMRTNTYLSEGLERCFVNELAVLQSLPVHPNVVQLAQRGWWAVANVADPSDQLYIVEERMAMDLYEWIEQFSERLTSDVVRRIMFQLLQAVQHCHTHRIMHRDIKPSNIMIGDAAVERVVLIDFGHGAMFGDEARELSPHAGSQWFRAPEMQIGKTDYDQAVDMWSVGCVFGEILCGELLPCQLEANAAQKGTASHLDSKPLSFENVTFRMEVDEDALNLLKRLLSWNPSDRISARDALRHSYFSTCTGLLAAPPSAPQACQLTTSAAWVQQDVTMEMRAILVDWLVEVAKQYQLTAHSFFVAVHHVDCFLHTQNIDQSILQLVGMAALLLATKQCEEFHINVSDLLYISDHSYKLKELLDMELRLAQVTQFRAHKTADLFVREHWRAGDLDGTVAMHLAEYLLVVYTVHHRSNEYDPSFYAACALFLTRHILHVNPVWSEDMEKRVSHSVERMASCIREMYHTFAQPDSTSPLSAARVVYSTEGKSKVALIPVHP